MTRLTAVLLAAAICVPSSLLAESSGDWTGSSVGGQLGFSDADTNGALDLDGDGPSVGFRAHYDFDLGTYIVGGGIELDSSDVELGDGTTSINDVVRLKARAGIDAGQNWYYGTFGYAQASIENPADDIGDSDGYFLGLGYEVFLSERATAGAELLYQNFEDFDLDGLEADTTTLNLSVNFRF